MGRGYTPKKSAFYSTFARQLCDDTLLSQWLSAFSAHSQTSKPTPANFTHTTFELENLYSAFFFFFACLLFHSLIHPFITFFFPLAVK